MTLRVPPEDFYQLIFELPKNRFLHTPSFVGMHYTDDLIILDVTFIQGRPKETRLALLKDINTRTCSSRCTKFPARISLSAKARRSAPTRSPAPEALKNVRFWPIAHTPVGRSVVRFLGVRGTWAFAPHMSACDPKRT